MLTSPEHNVRIGAGRPTPELSITTLSAGYGTSLVVRDVSAFVGKAEVAVVLGPNGCGKSTLLKAVTGQLRLASGRVHLGDRDISNRPSEELAALGVGYIPQENDIFPPLTVQENLAMGGYLLSKRATAVRMAKVYDLFPRLSDLRGIRAGRLSGGERKLLAIGRVLMLEPRVMVLDEPTAMLSPMATREVLAEHVRRLADSGTAVLLVEQKALQALEIADWAYVMTAGSVRLDCSAAELRARGDIGRLFLGHTGEAPRSELGRVSR